MLQIDVQSDPIVLEASGNGRRLPPSGGVAVHGVAPRMFPVQGRVGPGRVAVIADVAVEDVVPGQAVDFQAVVADQFAVGLFKGDSFAARGVHGDLSVLGDVEVRRG